MKRSTQTDLEVGVGSFIKSAYSPCGVLLLFASSTLRSSLPSDSRLRALDRSRSPTS